MACSINTKVTASVGIKTDLVGTFRYLRPRSERKQTVWSFIGPCYLVNMCNLHLSYWHFVYRSVTVYINVVCHFIQPHGCKMNKIRLNNCHWLKLIGCRQFSVFQRLPVCSFMPSVLWHGCLGSRQGIRPVKTVLRCWHGYLSGARCKWFAYGPADASATPSSPASLKSRMVYLSGAGLSRLSWTHTHTHIRLWLFFRTTWVSLVYRWHL